MTGTCSSRVCHAALSLHGKSRRLDTVLPIETGESKYRSLLLFCHEQLPDRAHQYCFEAIGLDREHLVLLKIEWHFDAVVVKPQIAHTYEVNMIKIVWVKTYRKCMKYSLYKSIK